MKNILLFSIIFSIFLVYVNSDINYLKFFNCIKNNENIRKKGDKILKGLKEDMFSTIITLVPDLEEHSEEFKICEQRANNSFEFDSICVLKCLNEFKNDYDYSCLSSCYY